MARKGQLRHSTPTSRAVWPSRPTTDDLKILPALRPVVGRTRDEAQAKFDELQALLDPLVGLNRLATPSATSRTTTSTPPCLRTERDQADPEHPQPRGTREDGASDHSPALREVAGKGGFCLIGTPADIVDVMQDWFEGDACDGFNITPTHLPAGCEDFVELITPELQRRGLMRRAYDGRTLRENLGLQPARNRFVAT